MSSRQHQSSLGRAFSAFAYTLSAIGLFLLAPLIEKHVRPRIYDYFAETFSLEIALWCSWGFVIVLGACLFFGGSALLQALVQFARSKATTRSDHEKMR